MEYDEVIDKLEQRIKDTQEELNYIGYYHTSDYKCEDLLIAIEAVKFMQKLVRCKDCEFYKHHKNPEITNLMYCDILSFDKWKIAVDEEEFCSLGVKKHG